VAAITGTVTADPPASACRWSPAAAAGAAPTFANDNESGLLKLSTIVGCTVAMWVAIYFAAQLLRGWLR
jgi:hypothetical protein